MADYFYYDPIDLGRPCLRLVKVLPLGIDGLVTCEITTRELPAKYVAVSYCWGSDQNLTAIAVRSDNNGEIKRLAVRSNVYNLLVHLAKENRKLPRFWIDAICIDQGNVHERNHQVRQMSSIYSGAKDVLIWLGEDTLVNDLLRPMAAARNKGTASFEAAVERTIRAYRKEFLHQTLTLLETNAYWSRLWIIQEVILASRTALVVFCGCGFIDWFHFIYIYRYLADAVHSTSPRDTLIRLESIPASSLRDLAVLRAGYSYGTYLPSMVDILTTFSTAKCADRRDKVYGLLSLAEGGSGFPVDYSLNLAEVFCLTWAYFAFHLHQRGSTILLSALGIDAEQAFKDIDNQNYRDYQPVVVGQIFLQRLGMTVVVDQPSRTQKIMKRLSQTAKEGVQSHPTCHVCKAIFPDLPSSYVQPNIVVWCTSLGTDSNYHVMFANHGDVLSPPSRPNPMRATAVHVSLSRLQLNQQRLLILRPDEKINAQFSNIAMRQIDSHETPHYTIYICPRLLLCLILLSAGHQDQLTQSASPELPQQRNQATYRKLENMSDTRWGDHAARLMMKTVHRKTLSSPSFGKGLLYER